MNDLKSIDFWASLIFFQYDIHNLLPMCEGLAVFFRLCGSSECGVQTEWQGLSPFPAPQGLLAFLRVSRGRRER
jgi:hypothetical protein